MAMTAEIDFRAFASTVGTLIDYAPGDTIFREGDEARYMYVVLHGSVEIASHNKILETIHDGNALGILSLIDGSLRTVTARAREATHLALIDRKKFRYMMEEMPNFCWYVVDELAHRLRTTNSAL